jgi:hypothetical protein
MKEFEAEQDKRTLSYWKELGKSVMITKPVLGKHYIRPPADVTKDVKVR